MDLTPYVAALRDDLAAAAAVGDEATTRAGSSLAAALEPAVRLALMNALSDLAGEVCEQLGDRTVSLRLSGREVKVVVDSDRSTEGNGFYAGPGSSPFAGTPGGGPGSQRHTPPPPPGPGFGGPGFGGQGFGGQGFGAGGPDVGDISRMTLRLVDQIKGQAEKAAAAQGMSLNSWIGQAVQGALKQHGRGGWGRFDEGWGGDSSWDENWRKGWDQGRPGSSTPSSGDDTPKDDIPKDDTPKDDTPEDTGRDRRDDEGGDGDVSGWVRG